MQDFWFYIKLGYHHVMDPTAYDHLLFLSALALPFTFRSWKKVLFLATVFTFAHCLSLALSAYGLLQVDTAWVEFLIPVTILLTAVFDLLYTWQDADEMRLYLHGLATAFFGCIHGLGFSHYFNMLVAGTDDKLNPLLGFAAGIEISQAAIILSILLLALLTQGGLGVRRRHFIVAGAIIVILITIPMLYRTFPR